MQKNSEIQTKVQADAIDFIYRNNDATEILLLVFPFVFALEGINFLPQSTILYWLTAMVLTVFIRYFVLWLYRRHPRPPIEKAKVWGHAHAGVVLVTGISWGVTSILFYLPEYPYHMVFVMVTMITLSISAVITAAYWKPSFYAYLFPSGLPLCIYLMFSNNWHLIILGGLGILLMVAAVFLNHKINTIMLESIALRYENADLLHNFKREKERAEKAYQANNRFLAAASHDLRQPLHALTLYLEPLVTELQNQRQHNLAHKAKQSAFSLTELLNAILDISRLDVNAITPNIQSVNISQIFEQLKIELTPQFQDKNLVLRVHPLAIWVKTDAVFAKRLLRNLLVNAWRFSQTGGVLLGARKRKGKLFVQVWDTGIGIAESELKNIFSEYVQLNNPERDRNKGLGLGLSIVQRLAQLLNLELDVRSRQNKGTVFSVGFTMITPPVVKVPSVKNSTDLKGIPIVVIDDDKQALDATTLLLQQWGCETLAISDYQHIPRLLSTWDKAPQLIISDYRLPNYQTGLDAIEMIRHYLDRNIPALIMSGDTRSDSLATIQKQNIPILSKPVSPARLRAFLTRLHLH